MLFNETYLTGCFTIQPDVRGDSRGWFARTFCATEFGEHGLNCQWLQMNHSFSSQRGTVRGLHFQRAPNMEVKLVRCVTGAVVDIVVDMRPDSPTYLRHMSVELSAENRTMLYIPESFAHGFQTLSDDTQLVYLHSAFYHPESEGGLNMMDPQLGIALPLAVSVMSDRDQQHPYLPNFTQ